MNTSDFLDDLERRVEEPWTDDDRRQLWNLRFDGIRVTSPSESTLEAYMQQSWHRAQLIDETRIKLFKHALKTLDKT